MIELSKTIYKIKIRGVWNRSEMTKKQKTIFAKIGKIVFNKSDVHWNLLLGR